MDYLYPLDNRLDKWSWKGGVYPVPWISIHLDGYPSSPSSGFYSDYFSAAFNGSFKEAAEQKLPLPNERVELFEIFNGFLYTTEIRSIQGVEGPDLRWGTIIDLWVFGDKYLVPALQNVALDSFQAKYRQVKQIPINQLNAIYENTLPESPLRKVIIDTVAYKGSLQALLRDKLHKWPKEALADLVLALNGKDPQFHQKHKMPDRGTCFYHVHAVGESC